MKWRQFIKDYLIFSKKERIALIAVLIIMSVIIFLPMFFTINNQPIDIKENDILENAIDSIATASINK